MTAAVPLANTPARLPKPSRAEVIVVCLLCVMRFGAGLGSVEFHPDESQWIATSAALEAFASADVGAPVWQESYWTLTHPPVARYVIGMGRRVGGYAAADLNRPWRWGADAATNRRAGAMPSDRLLRWARLPMIVLAAVSGATGFFLLAKLAGRVAAYCWVGAFLASPYLGAMLGRAMSEAPLLCATFISMLLAWRTLVRAARLNDAPSARRLGGSLLLVAFMCGLGAATKLTGAVLALPLLALAAWVAFCLRRRRQLPLLWCILLVALAAEVAAFTFVAVNPYLYPAPVSRSVRMVEQRHNEMREQAIRFAETRMPAGWERPARIGARVFHDFAPFNIDTLGLMNGVLCAIGLWWTIGIWRRAREAEAACAATVLLVAAAANTMPVWFSALDWDRYYMLPEVFALMFSAVGAAAVLGVLARLGARSLAVAALPQRAHKSTVVP